MLAAGSSMKATALTTRHVGMHAGVSLDIMMCTILTGWPAPLLSPQTRAADQAHPVGGFGPPVAAILGRINEVPAAARVRAHVTCADAAPVVSPLCYM